MIAFEVPGVAVAKQSFRYTANGGGYADKRVMIWEQCIGWYARLAQDGDPWVGCVSVELYFWLPDQKRRDLDNLSKAVLDGMKGICYLDDSQVVDLFIHKRIDALNPRVEIRVEEAA